MNNEKHNFTMNSRKLLEIFRDQQIFDWLSVSHQGLYPMDVVPSSPFEDAERCVDIFIMNKIIASCLGLL